ncbi:MAG: AGE family epimerase/isomerase [Pseudomonadota bacterium]
MPIPAEIHALDTWLKGWLFDHALPLWWEVGADRVKGGWFEKIGLDGTAVEGPRRARVAARQTYVYAMAGRLGWGGPWREAMAHALAALLGPFAGEDGLFRMVTSPTGAPLDDRRDPYDQAFALLALASAQEAGAGPQEDRALAVLAAMETAGLLRADGAVLHEGVIKANPMMHLFEAAQAWARVGASGRWKALAEMIARAALGRMIDLETGALGEILDGDWRPDPEADVEPGHQLEWGWLLLTQLGDSAPARRLIEIGETRGVERGVVIFSLDRSLRPRDRSARLWAQTERIHAHAVAGDWAGVLRGAEGLRPYLEVPAPGTWRDRLTPDGVFVEEPAPGSSLYHIVSAVMALDAARRG